MEMLEQLNGLFEGYILFAQELRANTSPMKMAMGFGAEEHGHPGHKKFYDDVAQWVESFAAQSPSEQEVLAALDVILFTAEDCPDKAAYWYLLAVQSHGSALIPLLSADVKEALGQRYDRSYPRTKRLPSQEEVYRLLSGGRKKKKWFSWK